jgi:alpha-L-arabinofuranosidase
VQSPDVEPSSSGGRVGVGTWNTAAEFRDFQVAGPAGKILFASDFSHDSKGWKLLGDGADWKASDGVLHQKAEREFIRALVSDGKWTDYTITLKARKISGSEGFLILFNVGNDDDHNWWNIGGWGNTQDGIEGGDTLDGKPSHIETGRWYDLKLTVAGNHVKCWLDGQLIHDVDFGGDKIVKALYATAATDAQTGDVIVKVINADTQPLATEVDLTGANLTGQGTATVLTSEKSTDENSLENPTKVSPKTQPVSFSGVTLTRSFPGNSFTVLRLQTR